MIQNTQKHLIHEYKRAARLSDPTYRDILHARAGVGSAADQEFSQSGFDQAMAALETVLFERVDRGQVPNPIGNNRYIRSRDYWRGRLGKHGKINSRQYQRIMQLWNQLGEWMPDDQRRPEYLAGIVCHATGKPDIGVTALNSGQAWCVIEALKDRLAHALKQANKQTAELPF